MFVVYLITHIPTSRHYVGKAKNAARRWSFHQGVARGSVNRPKHRIHHAIAKYGVGEFLFQVLETFETEQEAFDAEAFWIGYLSTHLRACGFNIALGGNGGVIPGEEVRAKIRAAAQGRVLSEEHKAKIGAASRRPRGPMSEVTKARISEANRGRKRTPEVVAHMSRIMTGRKMSPESIERSIRGRVGFAHTDESKAKIRAAKAGKPGKPWTLEQRSKLMASLVGHAVSDETREKIAAKARLRKRSDEARAKTSATLRLRSPNWRALDEDVQ